MKGLQISSPNHSTANTVIEYMGQNSERPPGSSGRRRGSAIKGALGMIFRLAIRNMLLSDCIGASGQAEPSCSIQTLRANLSVSAESKVIRLMVDLKLEPKDLESPQNNLPQAWRSGQAKPTYAKVLGHLRAQTTGRVGLSSASESRRLTGRLQGTGNGVHGIHVISARFDLGKILCPGDPEGCMREETALPYAGREAKGTIHLIPPATASSLARSYTSLRDRNPEGMRTSLLICKQHNRGPWVPPSMKAYFSVGAALEAYAIVLWIHQMHGLNHLSRMMSTIRICMLAFGITKLANLSIRIIDGRRQAFYGNVIHMPIGPERTTPILHLGVGDSASGLFLTCLLEEGDSGPGVCIAQFWA